MSIFKVKPIFIVLIFSVLVNSCSHYTSHAPVMPSNQRSVEPAKPVQTPKAATPQKSAKPSSSSISPKSVRPIKPEKRQVIEAGAKYYVVHKNETLYSIGLRSGHGFEHLALWNDLAPPYHVEAGQKLKLFNPRQENTSSSKQKDKIIVPKVGSSSQKKPNISIANEKVLKLNWQWPIKGRVVKNFSQSGNKGIDIHGQIGQKVQAAEAGKVVYSGKGLLGYGNLLIIKHDELFLSAYANNSRLRVTEGQRVEKGQIVAEVGRAGADRAALHFEIRKNGKSVNPLKYLPKK